MSEHIQPPNSNGHGPGAERPPGPGSFRAGNMSLNTDEMHQFLLRLDQVLANTTNQFGVMTRGILQGLMDPRRNIDKECGYPDTGVLSADLFRELFERDAIPNRAASCLPKESWQVTPTVYETEDPTNVTPFEQAWEAMEVGLSTTQSWHREEQGSSLWEMLIRADILSGIGRYGVILLGIDDGRDLQDPVDGVVAVPEGYSYSPSGYMGRRQPLSGPMPGGKGRHVSGPQTGQPGAGQRPNALRTSVYPAGEAAGPAGVPNKPYVAEPAIPVTPPGPGLPSQGLHPDEPPGTQSPLLAAQTPAQPGPSPPISVASQGSRGVPGVGAFINGTEAQYDNGPARAPTPQVGRPMYTDAAPYGPEPTQPQPILPGQEVAGRPTPTSPRGLPGGPQAYSGAPPQPQVPPWKQKRPTLHYAFNRRMSMPDSPATKADIDYLRNLTTNMTEKVIGDQDHPIARIKVPSIALNDDEAATVDYWEREAAAVNQARDFVRSYPTHPKVPLPGADPLTNAISIVFNDAHQGRYGRPAPTFNYHTGLPTENAPRQEYDDDGNPIPLGHMPAPRQRSDYGGIPGAGGIYPAGKDAGTPAPVPGSFSPLQRVQPGYVPTTGGYGIDPNAPSTTATDMHGRGPSDMVSGPTAQSPYYDINPPGSFGGQAKAGARSLTDPMPTSFAGRVPEPMGSLPAGSAATSAADRVGLAQPPGSSLSGTDQQYFGVQFGPSEQFSDHALLQPGQPPLRRLLFMRAFDESLVQIVRYEWNIRNPRFGLPVMYRITLNDPREQSGGVGLPLATVFVHWSRVIHLFDNRTSSQIFGMPRMKPIINNVLDLKKLYGAGAEGYWKSAFTALSFETNPQLGGDVDINIPELQAMYNSFVNGLQRAFFTRGMTLKSIAPSVTDPTPQIAAQIEAICIQLGIPVRVFKGSERGELASSQDDASWNDRLRFRQATYLTPMVIVPFIDRLIMIGVLPEPQAGYAIEWPDLDSLTDKDRAGIALQIVQAVAAYIQGGCEAIIPVKVLLTKILGYTDDEATMIIDEAKQQHAQADTMTTPPKIQGQDAEHAEGTQAAADQERADDQFKEISDQGFPEGAAGFGHHPAPGSNPFQKGGFPGEEQEGHGEAAQEKEAPQEADQAGRQPKRKQPTLHSAGTVPAAVDQTIADRAADYRRWIDSPAPTTHVANSFESWLEQGINE